LPPPDARRERRKAAMGLFAGHRGVARQALTIHADVLWLK